MISLKPLLKENVIHFYEWLNDDVAIRYSLSKFQNISSREDIQLWYEEMILDQKNFTSGIFLEETEELIGYAGICGISSANKSDYLIRRHYSGLTFLTMPNHLSGKFCDVSSK